MNENTFFVRYNWSGFVDGGYVSPTWTKGFHNRPKLVSVALYGPSKNFCGTWERHNMPLSFIRWMEQVIHDRVPVLPDDPQQLAL